MKFHQMEIFAAVVETRSFSKAGEKLYISQSTVTANIQALENELGHLLLQRTNHGAIPTDVGRRFYEFTVSTLHNKSRLLEELARDTDESIPISIVTAPLIGRFLLPSLLAGFHALHPNSTFRVTYNSTSDVEDMVSRRNYDLGFCGTNHGEKDCRYWPIASDCLVVITPNTSVYEALSPDRPFPLSLLLNSPILLREIDSAGRQEFERWMSAKCPGAKLNIAAEMADTHSIKKAVAEGMGIAVLSKLAVLDYLEDDLICAFPLEDAEKRTFFLLEESHHSRAEIAVKFRNYVLRHMTETK